MRELIKSGTGLIFMKVGTHARESLKEIVARKRKEIEQAGFAFWGYGGNTCHPISTVQPFAQAYERRGGVIYLCMQPMESRHFAIPDRATEYSVDGLRWERIAPAINVRGSRYALAIKSLHTEEFDLPLQRTRVAIGTSAGRPGSQYVRGRVDKACLEVADGAITDVPLQVRIGLTAEVIEPYAVIVRS